MSGFSPDHAGAEVRVSPNFGPRVDVSRPDMIILHYTGMKTGGAPRRGSARRSRRFPRIILSMRTAGWCRWCAKPIAPGMPAKSFWHGVTDINSRSSASRSSIRDMNSGIRNFTRRQIERGHRALPGDHRPPPRSCRSACLPIPMWRLAARSIPARNFRGVSSRKRVLAILSRRRAPAASGPRPGRQWGGGRGTSVHAVALWLRHRYHRPL